MFAADRISSSSYLPFLTCCISEMVPTLNIQLQQILDTSKDTSSSLAQGLAVMAKQEEVCIKWPAAWSQFETLSV